MQRTIESFYFQDSLPERPRKSAIPKKVRREIKLIMDGTPLGNRQERHAQFPNIEETYAKLRECIKVASDLAIAELCFHGHEYATAQFDRRLANGTTFQLNYLLQRGLALKESDLSGYDRKLKGLLSDGIARRAPTAPLNEVVTAIAGYAEKIGQLIFLDEILSYRNDWEELKYALVDEAWKCIDPAKFMLAVNLKERCKTAQAMREQRQRLAQNYRPVELLFPSTTEKITATSIPDSASK